MQLQKLHVAQQQQQLVAQKLQLNQRERNRRRRVRESEEESAGGRSSGSCNWPTRLISPRFFASFKCGELNFTFNFVVALFSYFFSWFAFIHSFSFFLGKLQSKKFDFAGQRRKQQQQRFVIELRALKSALHTREIERERGRGRGRGRQNVGNNGGGCLIK